MNFKKMLMAALALTMLFTVTACGGASSGNSDPNLDLAGFYEEIRGDYEFPMSMQLAEQEVQDIFYAGLSEIETEQCLVYANMMTMNMGEFALVKVTNSEDVEAVKAILQARIDTQVNGGAFYPEAEAQWADNSTVVSNGNYIMIVVQSEFEAIVEKFNSQF